jgi:voltage-gated potassium channel
MSESPKNTPYLLFTLLLSIFALVALTISSFGALSLETRAILGHAELGHADTALCVIFFVDFLVSFARAQDRWRYLYTWGWLDLLSSIPAIDAFRWSRAARIIRVLRVLRGIRAAKTLGTFLVERRGQSTFFATLLICLLLAVVGSASVLQFETGTEANIRTPEDALWWAVVTITTVGYGDRFPVSSEGRVIGTLLMTAGVGLFGTFSGLVASWFLRPAEDKSKHELERLTHEVAELKRAVLRNSNPSGPSSE